MRIYLDHNAGTPIRQSARDAMLAYLAVDHHGNPSSVHHSGQDARRRLEWARAQVAALIDAPARRVLFTSGGTEANNLAILGTARMAGRRRIISSVIEHSSILAPLAELDRQGFEVIRILPDREGVLDSNEIASAIDRDTALVTLGLANAEVGTVQKVGAIAEASKCAGASLHLDAVQAAAWIPLAVEKLGCDLMTLSAHKLGGPTGIGALYVRSSAAIAPLMLGGPHEDGLRAGTPNLIGALGFGSAADEVFHCRELETQRIGELSKLLLTKLLDAVPGLGLNAATADRLPNTLNLTFPAASGETLLMALDLDGIEVSMGSACAAGAVEPSHVLTAMGRSAAEARSSIRVSLGWSTTADDIGAASEIIPRVWRRVVSAESLAGVSL
jgi:cysteine desulfurase